MTETSKTLLKYRGPGRNTLDIVAYGPEPTRPRRTPTCAALWNMTRTCIYSPNFLPDQPLLFRNKPVTENAKDGNRGAVKTTPALCSVWELR